MSDVSAASSTDTAVQVSASTTPPPDFTASWRWWAAVGAPRHIAAPLVDASDLPWRQLVRAHGAQLCFTPMLDAAEAARDAAYLRARFSTAPGDRPLIAQLAGRDAVQLVALARALEPFVDAVDLNLGCPQACAARGRFGAFLLDEPARCAALVRALVRALRVPVTAKVRLLPARADTLALAAALEAAGAAAVTVHGRTRAAAAGDAVAADWAEIAAVKAALRIPVIANGGVACAADVARALAATRADGVMVGEALLDDPALFARGGGGCGGGDAPSRFALVRALVENARAARAPRCVAGNALKALFGVWIAAPDVAETFLAAAARLSRAADGSALDADCDAVLAAVDAAEARVAAVWGPAAARGADAAALLAALGAAAAAAGGDGAAALAPPAYLVDPAAPGAWYMRHRAGAYGGAAPPRAAGAPAAELRGAALGGFVARRAAGRERAAAARVPPAARSADADALAALNARAMRVADGAAARDAAARDAAAAAAAEADAGGLLGALWDD
jgi:tRNA-dihydrouridine synthase 1